MFRQPIWSISHQFGYKDTTEQIAKLCAKSRCLTTTALFLSSHHKRQSGMSSVISFFFLCWLFPITLLSYMCLNASELSSRRICSITSPGQEWGWPVISQASLAIHEDTWNVYLFHVIRSLHDLSKMIEKRLTMTLASTLGCILPSPICLDIVDFK